MTYYKSNNNICQIAKASEEQTLLITKGYDGTKNMSRSDYRICHMVCISNED